MALTAGGKMLIEFFVMTFLGAGICSAQIAYSRVIPYDPRYLIRRVPVRRSAEPEPRIRLPITRYFPQVDAQVAPAPYLAQEPVAPAAYRLADGEIYAVPSKWAEDVVPVSALERNEENDYDNYEYDNEYAPAYARPYPKDFDRDTDGDLYNDLMVNYLLGEMRPSVDENEISEVQRRSETFPGQYSSLSKEKVQEDIMKEKNATKDALSVSSTAAPEISTSATPDSSSPAAVVEPTTATSIAPRKAINMDSEERYPNDFAVGSRPRAIQGGIWGDFNTEVRGQKEFPYYRRSSESSMASLENQMSRGKNLSKNKEALPIIEKLMSAAHHSDPLKEQLDSLRFRNM